MLYKHMGWIVVSQNITDRRNGEAVHQEIRKVQSNGPYLLGGYCLGGLIAYELAQHFVEQGEEVAFLGLVSTVDPYHWKEKIKDLTFFKRICIRLKKELVWSLKI